MKTRTARFTQGQEITVDTLIPGLGDDNGPLVIPVEYVVEEVAEDWVSCRLVGDDQVVTFGNHPQALNSLDHLLPTGNFRSWPTTDRAAVATVTGLLSLYRKPLRPTTVTTGNAHMPPRAVVINVSFGTSVDDAHALAATLREYQPYGPSVRVQVESGTSLHRIVIWPEEA